MMDSLPSLATDHLVVSVLVAGRIIGLMVAIPSLTKSLPKRIQFLFAILITLLIVPAVVGQGRAVEIEGPLPITVALSREVVLGMLIGTAMELAVAGMQISSEFITTTGGLNLGQSQGTNETQTPTLGKFIVLFVVAILFAVGGHRLLLGALLGSFQEMPPGQSQLHEPMLHMLTAQITAGSIAGIKMAAPVVAALLLTNIVTGLISRTIPQINVLAVGLGVNALAFLVITAITLGSAGIIFQQEISNTVQRISESW